MACKFIKVAYQNKGNGFTTIVFCELRYAFYMAIAAIYLVVVAVSDKIFIYLWQQKY